MDLELILTETHGAVRLIRLNRPKALNALSAQLTHELSLALDAAEADASIAVIVLTGNDRAFAAGADIKEMKDFEFTDAYRRDFINRYDWERVTLCRKPVIAAVAGFALGGGCELAMMCDFILAADTARFGQTEITIGVIPGAGGSQRLTRLVGKSKAMELILTARIIDAEEAERIGLVARVVPAANLITDALATATKIAEYPRLAAMAAKEAVNAAEEMSLANGVHFERRLFHATFATSGQKEGMAAFVEKRPSVFIHNE